MVMVRWIFVVRSKQISCDILNSVCLSGRKMAERFQKVTTSQVHQIINNAVS